MHKDQEIDTLSMPQAQYDATQAYFEASKDILFKHTDVFLYVSTNQTDPSSLSHFETERLRQGFGYDNSSFPVLLSLIVISVYSLVVVLHLLYTFVTGNVGRSWDTFTELLLLALTTSWSGGRHQNDNGNRDSGTISEACQY